MLSAAREQIDGMRILYALQRLAFGQYVGGQWAALRASAEEAITLGNSVGELPPQQRLWRGWRSSAPCNSAPTPISDSRRSGT